MDCKKQSELLKAEAVRLLDRMFGIPEGHSNGTTDRIVDCIIGAAMMEISDIVKKTGE